MSKKRRSILTLPMLISTTVKLRCSLEAFMNRYDEQHLDDGERIFHRLLNRVWRNPYGKAYGADRRKEIEAVAWIDRFGQYLKELEGWIVHVMLRPDLFRALPWNQYVPCSAEECVRKLRLQERALARIHAEEAAPSGTRSDKADLVSLRNSLRDVANDRGSITVRGSLV